jgi:carboxyl-terminal processing protease
VPGDSYGLGITTSPGYTLTVTAPQEALPPLFITAVDPGSPAASSGCGPGTSSSRSTAHRRSPTASSPQGVMNLLFGPYPQPGQVTVRLKRPATGRTWAVTLTPALYLAPTPLVSAKLLDGDISNYLEARGYR